MHLVQNPAENHDACMVTTVCCILGGNIGTWKQRVRDLLLSMWNVWNPAVSHGTAPVLKLVVVLEVLI